MNITINREELLSAAQDADKVTPRHSPMEILGCTYLLAEDDTVTVAAGNLEIALERRIPAEIRQRGALVLKSDLLAQLLKLLEGETVTIIQDEHHMVKIKAGSAEYQIRAMNAKEYPRMEIPFPEDTVTVTGIPAMAQRTVFAVSEDETKPILKCVQLTFTSDGLTAVGSDGHRIASAKGDSKSAGAISMLLPATSLEKLAKLVGNKDELQVGTTGKTVVFTTANFAFSARLMEGQYFNSQQLLSYLKPAFTVLTDAEALREAIAAATVVSGKQNRFSLTFEGDTIFPRCESELGFSSSGLDIVALSGNPCGTYWYNPDKLNECLRAQKGTMMLDIANNGVLLLRTDDLTCMQMNIREPKPITVHEKSRTRKKKEVPKTLNNAA